MKKLLVLGALLCFFFIPTASHAAVTITSVTINGGSTAQVQPGDNINISVTANLTDKSKWKGTNWSISNNTNTFTTCVNSKNSKGGTQNNDNGLYTETFTIKAPAVPGIYSVNLLTDGANNCGQAAGTPYTIPQAVRVGNNILPPVIAAHSDILVTSATPIAVTYTNPTATDDRDQSVPVSCTPLSGSVFAMGDTVVTCTAHDSTGLQASPSTFKVSVVQPIGIPFTMASQSNDSFLCSPDWENCFTGGSAQAHINLGVGSGLGVGSLKSVTIAKDESSPYVSQPWTIQIECYTDSTYSTTCGDWVQPNAWNGNQTHVVIEDANMTSNNKYWTADFTNPAHEANSDGTTPVVFKANYYYRLTILDNLWNIGAYGSGPQGVPYYVVTGLTL